MKLMSRMSKNVGDADGVSAPQQTITVGVSTDTLSKADRLQFHTSFIRSVWQESFMIDMVVVL
jgi:hypothetical protein